jgi:hypothetical protein
MLHPPATLTASRSSESSMQFAHGDFARTWTDTNVLHAVHIVKVASCNPVDKPDKAMMHNLQTAAATPSAAAIVGSAGSIDRRIRAFLNGESHGEDVLDALYGHAADEPVPERLRAILSR